MKITGGRKHLGALSGVKQWNIYRLDIETDECELFRTINTNDEAIPKSFIKRFNALATRNGWTNAYIYKENTRESVACSR